MQRYRPRHRVKPPPLRRRLLLAVTVANLLPMALALTPVRAVSGTVLLSAAADTHLSSAELFTPGGDDEELTISAAPHERAYVRFDVERLPAPPSRATLRLFAVTSADVGYEVRATSNQWDEQQVTFANAPFVAAIPVARSAPFAAFTWALADVTALVAGQEPVSFAITTPSPGQLSFTSRESIPALAPQLQIEMGEPEPEPSPSDTPTPQPTDLPTPTPTASPSETVSPSPTSSPSPTQSPTPTQPPPPPPPPPEGTVIAAAGDIACAPGNRPNATTCHQRQTSDLLVSRRDLAAVLTLGDNQYDSGTMAQFNGSYASTWGRVKSITYPAPGIHEYQSAGAAGYFGYFGNAAGVRGQGWYSFDIAGWHLIALNSNCIEVRGCWPGNPQYEWLEADLAAHQNQCTLAYWHHPRFSSGTQHGSDGSYDAFWRLLYDNGVEIVLNGHEHLYERFAPQDPAQRPDSAHGIRQFTVGTGGKSHYPVGGRVRNSEVVNDRTFGVLMLTLRPGSYEWRFVPEAGATFTDTGTGNCHGAPGAAAAPIAGIDPNALLPGLLQ